MFRKMVDLYFTRILNPINTKEYRGGLGFILLVMDELLER